MVHANVPGNRVEPWKRRLAGAIGVPHLVNPEPGFLQQVVSICAALRMREKKPIQLRADALDEIRGSAKIALLIASHQCLEIAVRAHEFECLLAIIISASVFAQITRRRQVHGRILFIVFQAESPVMLLEAIARAQGLREDAGREILVSRSEPGPDGKPIMLTRRISIHALIDDADSTLNLTLTGGEEIRVPEVGKIYIMGNVKKPGAFSVQDGPDTTIMQMLALAEGLMPFSSDKAFIYRREPNGPKNEIPVSLDKIMKRQAPDVTLTANDILYIPDNRGKRLGIAALEKVLLFGSTAGATALIYTGR